MAPRGHLLLYSIFAIVLVKHRDPTSCTCRSLVTVTSSMTSPPPTTNRHPAACWSRFWLLVCLMLPLSVQGAALPDAAANKTAGDIELMFTGTVYPILKNDCIKCHGPEKHKGDVDFTSIRTNATAPTARATWRSCAMKLLAREMPPEKEA